MDEIVKALNHIKKAGLYPYTPEVSAPHNVKTIVDGNKVTLFASNNYLGMLNDPRVIEAAKVGLEKWGIGNGSARLLTGNLTLHNDLETKVAKFKRREAALTFVSGYNVNLSCIPAIVNILDVNILDKLNPLKKKNNTIVFSDELNHASAIIGIKLSGAQKEIYKHNDMQDLLSKIKKYPKRQRKLIVTDGVFSMDGDIVNLPGVVKIAREYNAMIYLDDAHGSGILGKNGRGTEELYGLEGSCDFIMGTFTKAFGGVGGYIASKKEAIEYLKITSNSFIFTAPIAPPVAAGLIKSIEIVENEGWRREKLLENASYLRDNLNKLGFDTLMSATQIIPVLIGDERKAQIFSKKLLEKGFFIPAARWPAVPQGSARLRIALMSNHSKKDMDELLDAMKRIREEL